MARLENCPRARERDLVTWGFFTFMVFLVSVVLVLVVGLLEDRLTRRRQRREERESVEAWWDDWEKVHAVRRGLVSRAELWPHDSRRDFAAPKNGRIRP